jgi:hypothetical protein
MLRQRLRGTFTGYDGADDTHAAAIPALKKNSLISNN